MKCKSTMVIVFKVILVLWLCVVAFFVALLAYDILEVFFIQSPKSLSSVKKSLNESLTIGYTYISTERIRQEYEHGSYKKTVYHFEDENGVAFKVSSEYTSGTPVPTRSTTCSYAYELIEAAEQPVAEALNSVSSLRWEKKDYGDLYRIRIEHAQKLALAASGVSKALQAVPPIPIKCQDYHPDSVAFIAPYIAVEFAYSDESLGNNISRFPFSCLFEGEEVPTEEQILQKLQNEYDKLVEMDIIAR